MKQNIDLNKCMSRKNLKDGINCQCSFPKKYGDYCGFHKDGCKKRIRIDEALILKETKIKYSEKIEPLNFFEEKMELYSIKSLKNFLNQFKINTRGFKKKDLFKITKYWVQLYKNIDKIIKIQSICRKFLVRKYFFTKNVYLENKNLLSNDEDFYTLDNFENLHIKYIFSYKDDKNFIFTFDSRSFDKLLENNNKLNPYTREPISEKTIKLFYEMKKIGKIINLDYKTIPKPELTLEQKFKQKVISIFHKIDELDYHTDINWFFNLNIIQLKHFYKSAEDIWNYRAEIKLSDKNKIVPNKSVFKIPVWIVLKLNDKRELQYIILNEIEKFVSFGQSREDKILGAMYMLTALVEVSTECAQAMPWLIQGMY